MKKISLSIFVLISMCSNIHAAEFLMEVLSRFGHSNLQPAQLTEQFSDETRKFTQAMVEETTSECQRYLTICSKKTFGNNKPAQASYRYTLLMLKTLRELEAEDPAQYLIDRQNLIRAQKLLKTHNINALLETDNDFISLRVPPKVQESLVGKVKEILESDTEFKRLTTTNDDKRVAMCDERLVNDYVRTMIILLALVHKNALSDSTAP